MLLKEYIAEKISKAIKELYDKSFDIEIEIPKNQEFGDYSSNISFLLAKKLKKSPQSIAGQIAEKINLDNNEIIGKAEGAFINIIFKDEFLNKLLMEFNKVCGLQGDYSKIDIGQGKKVLIEYVSANPTGPLHIGHGRWAAIGDTLKKMLNYCGFSADSEYYINDAGVQVKKLRQSIDAVKQGQNIPEDGYHGKYIDELAKNTQDPVDIILKEQKETLNEFRVDFDNWFSEKKLYEAEKVEKALKILRDKNVLYDKDGALWFKSSEFGDDKDRVLIKSDGEKTYFASDIAYHEDKIERGYEWLINIWGTDHHGYVTRLKSAINALYSSKGEHKKIGEDKFKVILGQLVTLFQNGQPLKMSKRTGEMITLKEVIDEIGVDAARYWLVMRSPDTHLDFDLDLAKEQSSNNPVYYVQYAHARICSILRKAEEERDITEIDSQKLIIETLEPDERDLLLKILRFSEELVESTVKLEPHRLPRYAEELAAIFHSFYTNCRVINEDKKTQARRLVYIKTTKIVLKNILNLLGVSAPEKM